MSASDIAMRMLDYFDRQIALFEDLEARLIEFPAADDIDAWEALAQYDEADRKRIAQLEEEFGLLSREWNATENVDPALYDQVHAQAAKAQAMADRLEARYAEGAAKAQGASAKAAASIGQVNKGKQAIGGYKPGVGEGPGSRIDSQA